MDGILIGRTIGGEAVHLLPQMANRHGLIAGATGTGKTVTLQLLAEGFSALGVPVFTADVKGDLSGLARPGEMTPKLAERLAALAMSGGHQFRSYPVAFWDLYAKRGHPVRASVSEVGPLLLARMLGLNDIQEQVLQLAFRAADDQGLLLLDSKDLAALLTWIAEHAGDLRAQYGNIAPASLGAIQRALLNLAESGGDGFFGEPALQLSHLMQRDYSGNGVISILDATLLLHEARLYASFLLWLLSELFEELDEVGDRDKPRLVFFFDEAHLLFRDAPRALVDKIEQIVRLIRSKGVGVYFITQNPLDIPERVLGQLGNRVQHALRAFTPADQRAVRAAAETFRQNPKLDTRQVICELAVGEALVSTLDCEGRPRPVERVMVSPPYARIGPIDEAQRREIVSLSPMAALYDKPLDRESAFEVLQKRRVESSPAPAQEQRSPAGRRQGPGEALLKSILRSAGSTLGREIMRGILGSIRRA